nr:hypothetical protein [Tanacetum cinerariifolium]
MTLFNENYDNCIYGNGKPIICTACGSMVKGGLCLTCDFRERNLYNCDPNAYSFDNTNYFPQSQYKNYLCNLCENNSHDGDDCQQQFPFVHEQELSYNQNYDVSTDNLSNRFSGSDQIQTPHYPEIHSSSSETSDEVFQANHSIQNEESFGPSNEIAILNSNQEKKEPSQESDIHQLIEECSTEVSEKQKMEDTMLELFKIYQEKEFLCIYDDVDDLIESALDSKLLLINSNSQRLDKKEQKVKNVVEQPIERGNRSIQSLQNFKVIHKSSISFNTSQISSVHAIASVLSTKEPEHLLSMGYKHLSIIPETESNEVTYVEEENVVQQEEKEVNFEDISQIQDVVLREKLLSIIHLIFNIESLNDTFTLDRVFNSFESDNFLLDNFSPEFETFCDHSEETRSGNTTHANYSLPEYDSFCFEIEPNQERLINIVKNNIPHNLSNDPLLEEVNLFLSNNSIPPGIKNVSDDPEGDIRFLEELLIDDSILSHESSDSNLEDNPLILRPPPEPPDVETDAGEEIPVVMNEKDEDVDYTFFIFVIYPEMFPLLLSAESEDNIFDLGLSPSD